MKTTLLLLAATVTFMFGNRIASAGAAQPDKFKPQPQNPTRGYTNGPIALPTPEDIDLAVKFGSQSKESGMLDKAYTFNREAAFANNKAKVFVVTPICLVAQTAREAIRNYETPPDSIKRYAATCGVVRLILQNHKTVASEMRVVIENQIPILIRDGVRVPPLLRIPSLNGFNPFLAVAPETVLGRKNIFGKRNYAELSEPSNGPELDVSLDPGYFPVSELNKPGKYEIVFRTQKTDFAYTVKDTEIRFEFDPRRFK